MRMRLHVLLLLLLALPLRGWVGDAMAMDVAQAALRADAAPSTAAAPMAHAAMPADCPMHQAGPAAGHAASHMTEPMTGATAARSHTDLSHPTAHGYAADEGHAAHTTAADPAGEPYAGHAGACLLCDICHGASLVGAPAALGAVAAPHAAPEAASTRFVSVLRAPDLRPPIL